MGSEIKDHTGFAAAVQSTSKLLVWIGASAGSLTLVLTVLGYLVEHAYLDSLGVPRTFYEAMPAEYVTGGGKFLIGTIPLATIGAPQFALRYWWLALLILATAGAAWRWRWRADRRWLAAAGLLAIWLTAALARLEAPIASTDANALVAMFTTVIVAAVVYAYVELAVTSSSEMPSRPTLGVYAARLPFFVLLISGILVLPYLRGTYALTRSHPTVEFLGKDQQYFCELAGTSASACGQDSWQLIEVGTGRAILRRAADNKLYVVPAATLNTFRIVSRETDR